MAMTARTVTLPVAVVGDAVRAAMMTELLHTVAATIRFMVLNPMTWPSQRYTEEERDMLRATVERIECCTPAELVDHCPLCRGFTCHPGCALESVRAVAEAQIELADATPTTEANRQ